jgi:hypothetical protein
MLTTEGQEAFLAQFKVESVRITKEQEEHEKAEQEKREGKKQDLINALAQCGVAIPDSAQWRWNNYHYKWEVTIDGFNFSLNYSVFRKGASLEIKKPDITPEYVNLHRDNLHFRMVDKLAIIERESREYAKNKHECVVHAYEPAYTFSGDTLGEILAEVLAEMVAEVTA